MKDTHIRSVRFLVLRFPRCPWLVLTLLPEDMDNRASVKPEHGRQTARQTPRSSTWCVTRKLLLEILSAQLRTGIGKMPGTWPGRRGGDRAYGRLAWGLMSREQDTALAARLTIDKHTSPPSSYTTQAYTSLHFLFISVFWGFFVVSIFN